jgi:proteasome lid subunit RPN8/RPN11
MKKLILTKAQVEQIENEGISAYPNECCGVLIGRDVQDGELIRRIVDRLEPLANSFQADEQFHRFSLSPKDLMNAEKSASGSGMLVLGFYHSHPDHPARPSEYDREHGWPFYSYLIVAIAKRDAVDMTSWQLDEVTETFSREDIEEVA